MNDEDLHSGVRRTAIRDILDLSLVSRGISVITNAPLELWPVPVRRLGRQTAVELQQDLADSCLSDGDHDRNGLRHGSPQQMTGGAGASPKPRRVRNAHRIPVRMAATWRPPILMMPTSPGRGS